MKRIIIALLILAPGILFAQTNEDKIWETAKYDVTKNGLDFFYTDVNVQDTPYDEKQFNRIKNELFTKEGIAKVELLDLNRTIRIYHYDYITVETIKFFVVPFRPDVEFMEATAYDFH